MAAAAGGSAAGAARPARSARPNTDSDLERYLGRRVGRVASLTPELRPGPARTRSWQARRRSSWRERIPSLPNTLRRCHSTVRGLRNSRAPISGFDSPSRASSRDLPLLRGQIVARLDRPLAHLLARRQQLPARALGERLHPDRRELLVGGAELLARVDPATLAAQPLAVEQVRAGELGPQPGAAQPLDRLAIQALGGRRPRSAAPGSAPRCRAPSRCRRAASSPPAARAHRARARRLLPRAAASTSSGSAHMETTSSTACRRWLAGPPTPPPRSGPRPLYRTAAAHCAHGRRDPLPSGRGLLDRARSARRPRPPCPASAASLSERVGRDAAPGRRRYAVGLRDQRGGTPRSRPSTRLRAPTR